MSDQQETDSQNVEQIETQSSDTNSFVNLVTSPKQKQGKSIEAVVEDVVEVFVKNVIEEAVDEISHKNPVVAALAKAAEQSIATEQAEQAKSSNVATQTITDKPSKVVRLVKISSPSPPTCVSSSDEEASSDCADSSSITSSILDDFPSEETVLDSIDHYAKTQQRMLARFENLLDRMERTFNLANPGELSFKLLNNQRVFYRPMVTYRDCRSNLLRHFFGLKDNADYKLYGSVDRIDWVPLNLDIEFKQWPYFRLHRTKYKNTVLEFSLNH